MKKFINLKIVAWMAISILLLDSCSNQQAPSEKPGTFSTTLNDHLEAVSNRDINQLKPTVADSVTLIFPDGSRLDSKNAFMEFHKNWFEQTNWTWQGRILQMTSSDSLGYGLVQYKYVEKDSLGNIRTHSNSYLLLVFKKFKAGWQLIHDQNTKIKM